MDDEIFIHWLNSPIGDLRPRARLELIDKMRIELEEKHRLDVKTNYPALYRLLYNLDGTRNERMLDMDTVRPLLKAPVEASEHLSWTPDTPTGPVRTHEKPRLRLV
jgi:hypothetical protein